MDGLTWHDVPPVAGNGDCKELRYLGERIGVVTLIRPGKSCFARFLFDESDMFPDVDTAMQHLEGRAREWLSRGLIVTGAERFAADEAVGAISHAHIHVALAFKEGRLAAIDLGSSCGMPTFYYARDEGKGRWSISWAETPEKANNPFFVQRE